MKKRNSPLATRALSLGLAILTVASLGVLLAIWDPFGHQEPRTSAALIVAVSPGAPATDNARGASRAVAWSESSTAAPAGVPSSANSDSPFDSDTVGDIIGMGGSGARPAQEPATPESESYVAAPPSTFVRTATAPLSTFSIDVDTASYTNVRRFLRDGQLPPPDAVRVEEFLNAFTYTYEEPKGEAPLALHVETGACPWAPEHRLVHVGLQSKRVSRDERPPMNLVFLIDASGSMRPDNKLPLVKHGLALMVGELDERDRVAIVTYASNSRVHLASTSGSNKDALLAAIDALHSGGSTNGESGILDAYRIAEANFREDGQNRVILATDGDFNVGITSRTALTALIEKEAESGVFLTVLGFGTGNLQDAALEKLADHGNGQYAYVDNFREARRVFVQGLPGMLAVAAKDVKIQVEFNPLEVDAYRLVGYANRRLAARDFNDDTKDAGEVGLGHSVTALYEIIPSGRDLAKGVDPLKYQASRFAPLPAARTGELMTLKLRWKEPDSDHSQRLDCVVRDSDSSLATTSNDFRFAAALAETGMLLAHSEFAGNATLESALALATGAVGPDLAGERTEFLDLVARAKALSPKTIASRR